MAQDNDDVTNPQTETQKPEAAADDAPAAACATVEAADPQQEIADLKDQVLRALAEAENTRRRMKKEVDDTQKYAIANFAKDILAVADNLGRALDAMPKDAVLDDAVKSLVTGIEATERQLYATFERFGIKKIDPMGQMFDPHLHRVMMEQEDPSKPAGTITMVMQAGYMIHDRLLREALVAVSKGGAPVHKVDTSA